MVDDGGILPSCRSLSFTDGKDSGRKLARIPVCANDGGAFGRRSLLDRVVVESRPGPTRVVPRSPGENLGPVGGGRQ